MNELSIEHFNKMTEDTMLQKKSYKISRNIFMKTELVNAQNNLRKETVSVNSMNKFRGLYDIKESFKDEDLSVKTLPIMHK